MDKNIHTFLACDSDYENSDIVLFGAPFDGTCSYRPGTRFASAHIRNESYGIETYSPYLDRDLTDIKVFDAGDLELCFGDTEAVLSDIYDFSKKLLGDGKRPLMIGGEHLVTLPAVKATFEMYPKLYIVHFDAHTDLRDEYLGQKLSHSSVIRRCHELLGDKRILQYGIRSGEREEFAFATEHLYIRKFDFEGIERIKSIVGDNPVYFTIDLDVLDSSVFPGTGTSEAGGVTYKELLNAVNQVFTLNVVACDINELSPMLDPSGASTAAACKLVREVLLQMAPVPREVQRAEG